MLVLLLLLYPIVSELIGLDASLYVCNLIPGQTSAFVVVQGISSQKLDWQECTTITGLTTDFGVEYELWEDYQGADILHYSGHLPALSSNPEHNIAVINYDQAHWELFSLFGLDSIPFGYTRVFTFTSYYTTAEEAYETQIKYNEEWESISEHVEYGEWAYSDIVLGTAQIQVLAKYVDANDLEHILYETTVNEDRHNLASRACILAITGSEVYETLYPLQISFLLDTSPAQSTGPSALLSLALLLLLFSFNGASV